MPRNKERGSVVLETNQHAITLRGVRKSFGDKTVLDGIDLDVRTSSIFALLGENGAGKTTAVRILTTLLLPDGGSAQICGIDVVEQAGKARSLFSLAGQFAAVDDVLTGRENLQMMARLRRIAQPHELAADLLARFDLVDAAGRRVATWSGGMRRRLDLAMSLVGNPRVVFLDEPTTGLDPQGRRAVWQMVREMAQSGTTIFLTTQYLEEAEALADEVAILKEGYIIAQGTPAELKRRFPGGFVDISFEDGNDLERTAVLLGNAVAHRNGNNLSLTIATDGSVRSVKAILDAVEREQVPLAAFAVRQPTLEEVFLTLTGTQETESAG